VRIEARHADSKQPGRDRHRLFPVRPPLSGAKVHFLDEHAVGNHLEWGRCRHDHLAGRLVVRMIDRRQPMPCPVRPALAEHHPLTMHIGKDAQTVGRRSRIRDDVGDVLTGLRRCGQRQAQAIVVMSERDRVAGGSDALDSHPLAA
jgi:hypothetical protein